MQDTATQAPLKVYWQPGCSSCLKTKEFLIANGVEFQSVNVIDDENGFRELEELGVRMVPIVARGKDWANGQVFRDVARVAGFAWDAHDMLSPAELMKRANEILPAARRYTSQIPEDRLDEMLVGRPRSYRQLAYHVFNIPEVFLDYVEKGVPYEYGDLGSTVPVALRTRADLLDWAQSVIDRLNGWWQGVGQGEDFSRPADVYYGKVSLHEFMERSTWHPGQHTRQLMLTLEEKLGIEPEGRLDSAVFDGLPMPKEIWDNEKTF